MFGFQCIGYGIQNAGWNHNWMYPGPCYMPMYMGHRHCGYDPGLSDGILIGQSVLSGLNGIVAGLDAHYNKGADGFTSARVALGTATAGTSNALWGNFIDKCTGTYFGSMTNSILTAWSNPFGYMSRGAMFSPFGGPFGVGF